MKKMKLQRILKQLMEERNISARELARECKIPQSTIASYLSGRGTQSPEHILTIAQYFGTSMENLLFGEDRRPPTLDEVMTEGLFEGWLKVKIERAIPNMRRGNRSGEDK